MDFQRNYFSKKHDVIKALLLYTFQNISSIFGPNRNSMLQFAKNDGTVPFVSWKFLPVFPETHGRGLGNVAHASSD